MRVGQEDVEDPGLEAALDAQIAEHLAERGLEQSASVQESELRQEVDELTVTATDLERLHNEMRQPGDIPKEDGPKYQEFIESSLDDPDEIWHFVDHEANEWYTFIARYSGLEDRDDVADEFMMIVVCEATKDEKGNRSFEPVFAFPTIDAMLVQHFRKGINSLNKAFGVGWATRLAA